MRIKHWSGYGSVNAVRINDGTAKLHIRVSGNHERGLHRADPYDLYHWLVRRFDRSVPDYLTWSRSAPLIDADESFCKAPDGSYVDSCDYYFYY